MAEGGGKKENNSPIISPIVKELNNDQLMQITDDIEVFSSFYEEMVKHSREPNKKSPEAVAAQFLQCSTPITRSYQPQPGGVSSGSPLTFGRDEDRKLKAYLMVRFPSKNRLSRSTFNLLLKARHFHFNLNLFT